jgi:hypothetical protein
MSYLSKILILLAILAMPACVPVEAIVSTPTSPPTRSPVPSPVAPSVEPTQPPPPALTPTVRPTYTSTPTLTSTPEWGGSRTSVMMVYFNGFRLQNQVPQTLRKYLTPTSAEQLRQINTTPIGGGDRLPWGKVIFLDKDGSPWMMFSAVLRAVDSVTGIPNIKGAQPSAFVIFEIPVRGGSIFYIVQHGDKTIESLNFGYAVPTVGRGELPGGQIPVGWLESSREKPVDYWKLNWVYRLPQFDAADFYRKRVGQAVLLAMPTDQSEDNRMFSQSVSQGMLLPNVAFWDVMVLPNFVMPDSMR